MYKILILVLIFIFGCYSKNYNSINKKQASIKAFYQKINNGIEVTLTSLNKDIFFLIDRENKISFYLTYLQENQELQKNNLVASGACNYYYYLPAINNKQSLYKGEKIYRLFIPCPSNIKVIELDLVLNLLENPTEDIFIQANPTLSAKEKNKENHD